MKLSICSTVVYSHECRFSFAQYVRMELFLTDMFTRVENSPEANKRPE